MSSKELIPKWKIYPPQAIDLLEPNDFHLNEDSPETIVFIRNYTIDHEFHFSCGRLPNTIVKTRMRHPPLLLLDTTRKTRINIHKARGISLVRLFVVMVLIFTLMLFLEEFYFIMH